MTEKTELGELLDQRIFPAVYNSLDRVLPEYEFKREADHWVSQSDLKVTGERGNKSKVYVYPDRPFFLKDYTRGGKAITSYLQDSGHHPGITDWLSAVEYLAERAGIPLPSGTRNFETAERLRRETTRAEILEAANNLFIESLGLDEASSIRAYIQGRGYGPYVRAADALPQPESVKMELGYLHSQDLLRRTLRDDGYAADEITEAIKLNPAAGSTNCLTIPIRDPLGRIKGFAFRDINWQKDVSRNPKYVYSTGLERGSLLFSLRAIKADKDLVVVEGLLDALFARAKGLTNVVALGGTSLGEAQVRLALDHGAEKITLCLDGDTAGRQATQKAIDAIRAVSSDVSIYVAALTAGFKDPDELIRAEGIDAFRAVMKKAKPWYRHRLDERLQFYEDLQAKTGEIDAKDQDQLLRDAIAIGGQIDNLLDRDRFTEDLLRWGSPLGLRRESLDAVLDDIQAARLQERRAKDYAELLKKANALSEKGRLDDLQELLHNHSKQGNDLEDGAAAFRELVAPITEAEVRAKIQSKPKSLKSGYRIEGDEIEIPAGAITILAGPTNHGKTTFLVNLALNVARLQPDKQVYFISYEEAREPILLKAINTYANLHLSENNRRSIESYYRTGEMEFIRPHERAAFEKAHREFYTEMIEPGRLNIQYASYSTEELVAAIRLLKKNTDVGAVFIDYVQFLRLANNRTGSRQEELKQICLNLKDCAVETGLPLILGAQFNRTVLAERDLSPIAIGEAGDIERIANLTIGFWNRMFVGFSKDGNIGKDGQKREKEEAMYVEILKGRDVKAGSAEVFGFNGNTGRISNRGGSSNYNPFN